MKKKRGFTIAFLATLSLIAGFITLKKVGFEDAFSFDSLEEDPNETL